MADRTDLFDLSIRALKNGTSLNAEIISEIANTFPDTIRSLREAMRDNQGEGDERSVATTAESEKK